MPKAPSKKASKKTSREVSRSKSSSETRRKATSGRADKVTTPTSRLTDCELICVYSDMPTDPDDACPIGCQLGPLDEDQRADCAEQIRVEAAAQAKNPQRHCCNGDEACFQGSPLDDEPRDCGDEFEDKFIASFTKGLPHDEYGEVTGSVYCDLLKALGSAEPEDFETVQLGCTDGLSRKLDNPQAAFAFDLQGADSHSLVMPPAPSFDSAQEIAEIAENHWMALTRDVPFTEYSTDPLIAEAADDLSQYQCFEGPTNPEDLFRGFAFGERVGPYVSQFLYMDVPYGAQFIPAMIRTVLPGVDYMTAYDDWLSVQNGCDRSQTACDPVPRFIRNGRDLGQYVHVDLTFNAFLEAALILLSGREPLRRCEARPGLGTPFAKCLPYVNPMAPGVEEFPGKSGTQLGFSTFGPPQVVSLLLEVMNRALKAVWFQKWAVHRRLRPEEFAGRIHNHLVNERAYPFEPGNFAQLQEVLLPRIFEHNERQNCNRRMPPSELPLPDTQPAFGGTYLLPMAFAEGSPLHPAYGAGHATVAGACGTILKAFFPENQLILNPVVSTPDGLSLVAFRPQKEDDERLTVEGEINKLVGNISLGRNFAGVHWRSDYSESIKLGENLAISLLCDQRNVYNEAYEFQFRRYDGRTRVRIRPGDDECPVEQETEPVAIACGDMPVECDRRRRPNAPGC